MEQDKIGPHDNPKELVPLSIGSGVLPQIRAANEVLYTYKDLEAAFDAGVLNERYQDEYIRHGSSSPTFEEWFKDEFSAEKDERNDSE